MLTKFNTLKKIGLVAVIAIAILYGLVCAFVYTKQREMLYFPTPDVTKAIAEPIYLDSQGESLKIWYQARTSNKAVLYFGGNAENTARSMANLRTAFPSYSILAMNYRGYGGSTGEPSESAFISDAEALYDAAMMTHDEIYVVGRSLGSSVAVQLASRKSVTRLILVTPFDSIVDVARERYWMLPVGLLLRDRFDSAVIAPQLRQPTLLVLAENDETISRERSLSLLGAFADDIAVARIIDATDHQTISGSPDYLTALRDFFAN